MLIRIETKAGHGAGKPTAKLIEEIADMYAFLSKTFGIFLKKNFRLSPPLAVFFFGLWGCASAPPPGLPPTPERAAGARTRARAAGRQGVLDRARRP